jgi:uncharacterized protein (DUF58 family)
MVRSQTSGEAKSPFKGSGLEFDDVRAYAYGDDVRAIDWKVSARTQTTYIKTFKEEKDQAVYLLVDASASMKVGLKNHKQDQINRIAGTLMLAAAEQGSQVGFIGFTNRLEKIIKAKKGLKHTGYMINSLIKFLPNATGTNIGVTLRNALGVIKRTAVIIIISDFIDTSYERELKALGKKHDVILIQIAQEEKIPRLGIIPVRNAESGKINLINTSFGRAKRKLSESTNDVLKTLCNKHQIDHVKLNATEEITQPLTQLFIRRNRKWKRA